MLNTVMSKTHQLIKLLEERSCNPENPYGYVAGYLAGIVEQFEMEYKSAADTLDMEIKRVKNLNQGGY